MSEAEEVGFRSEGLEIRGSLWKADGPGRAAVLLCHGTFETRDNWDALAKRLSQDGYSVLAFDFAGHGASGGLRGSVDLAVWAYNIRDALSYLEGRGFSRIGLVGWESGGSAGVLAAAHDVRLSCAVIISAPVYLLPAMSERVAYILASGAGTLKMALMHKPLTLSRLKQMKELRIISDEEANEAYFSDPKVQEIYNAFPVPAGLDNVWVDIREAAGKVKVPVLVIHGAEDRVVPSDQGKKLHGLVQGRKELRILDGASHAIHLDRQRDALYELIRTWMKDHL